MKQMSERRESIELADGAQKSSIFAVGLLALVAAASAATCLATDPPPQPKHFPPQVWTPSHFVPQPLPLPAVPVRLNRHQLDLLPLSPTLYRAMVAWLKREDEQQNVQSPANMVSVGPLADIDIKPTSPANPFLQRLRPLPLMTPDPPWTNASQLDSPHETGECAIIVHPQFYKSLRADINTAIVPFVRYATPNPGDTSQIRVALSTDFSSWSVTTPPISLPYTASGDPALASNTYSDTSIFHARRAYVAGTHFNGTLGNGDNEIHVWYADTVIPGAKWDGCVMQADMTFVCTNYVGISPHLAGQGYFDDKPAIAVSLNAQTAGYVYLAHMLNVAGTTLEKIEVYRLNVSTDTWELVSEPVVGQTAPPKVTPQSPRLDVDPATGSLYLSWLDWDAFTLNVMVSPGPAGQGTTWSPQFSVPAGNLLSYNGRDIICPTGSRTNCVEARSMHSSRFNSPDGSLELAWHQRKVAAGDNARVVLRKFHYDSVNNTGVFSNEAAISDRLNDEQWQPAVDVAPDGTCLVTYYDYDHADGSDRVAYRLYGRKVNADGTAISGEVDTRLYSSSEPSDSTRYTLFSAWNYTFYTLGEYEDVWYRSASWSAAGVYVGSTMNKGDVIVTRPQ